MASRTVLVKFATADRKLTSPLPLKLLFQVFFFQIFLGLGHFTEALGATSMRVWSFYRSAWSDIYEKMNIARGMGLFVARANYYREHLFSPKNLLYTNVGISISLSAVGDILEQHYEILKGEWDRWSPSRTRNMAISGMSIGIICHHWYRYLDSRLPGRTIGIVAKKVVIDQLICSPLCIAMFFITLGILEKSNWSELRDEIREKAHRLYIAEWVVWPPAQIINFYILPTRYRVLYDNTISLGYDVYTSQVKHDKPKSCSLN